MTYDNFKQSVLDAVHNHFPDSTTAVISSVTKNNGQIYDALVINEAGSNISPSIYLNQFYNKTLDCTGHAWTMDRIMESIFKTYSEVKITSTIDVSFFTDFDSVKEHLFIRLINKDFNRELLKDIPHVEYLDLVIVFSYFSDHDVCDGIGSILIHNNLLDVWNISREDLYKIALNNTPKLLGHNRFDMSNMMDCCDSRMPFIVLSNNYQLYGASVLCDIEELDSIATALDSDLTIIPSSVHEVIVFKSCDSHSTMELTDMIHTVNNNELEPEEILSYHPYFYLKDLKKVIY